MPPIPPAGRALLLTLALLAAPPAAAQDLPVVTPGSDLLDLDRITSDTTRFAITVVQGTNRQPFGTVTRTVTVDEAAGEVVLLMEMEAMGNKFADTTRAAWPSLAARTHRSENPQRALSFDVADGRLTGEHRPAGGAAESFDLTVDEPIFDSALMGEIAAALPLAADYAATVPAYEFEAGGVADYTVRVLSGEKLAREGKAPVDVWIVEATRPEQDQVARLYFTKDGHDLVRIRIEPQPGIEVLIDAE
jgi:hypothetical protein